MPDHADIACRLLRVEQSLKAYERLHADELAELWRTLNDCKQLVTVLIQAADSAATPAGAPSFDPEATDELQAVPH
jgi:hypothetical protein